MDLFLSSQEEMKPGSGGEDTKKGKNTPKQNGAHSNGPARQLIDIFPLTH
jgi:hypothetical protein